MSDQTSKPSIDQCKAAAKAEVVMNNPLVAYHKHLQGREKEYSYAEFLRDIKHPHAPQVPVSLTTTEDIESELVTTTTEESEELV